MHNTKTKTSAREEGQDVMFFPIADIDFEVVHKVQKQQSLSLCRENFLTFIESVLIPGIVNFFQESGMNVNVGV